MKRSSSLAVVLAFVAAACGGSSSTPTSPSPAAPPRFTATLTASSEVPAVTNADSSASGSVTITMNTTKDAAGAITAATADFVINASNFPSGTVVTAAHIHPGAAGVAGGVLVPAFGTGEFTLSATGTGTLTKTSITVAATDAQAIINNPAGFYFNIHTALNPGGAIRGQLVRSN